MTVARDTVARDRAFGWVDVTRAGTTLDMQRAFVAAPPRARASSRAFDAEVAGLEALLATVPAGTP